MADEITVTTTLSLANGTLVASFAPQAYTPDQSTGKISNQVQSIGTSEEVVDFGDVSSEGFLCVQNHDATNYVEFGPESGGSMVAIGKVKPGETALLRLKPGVTIRAQANTASCDVQFCLLAD